MSDTPEARYVWVVEEGNYDHHAIVGIFDSEAAARDECDYCTRTALAVDSYPNSYDVRRYELNRSGAAICVQFQDLGHGLLITGHVHFDATAPSDRAFRVFDPPHDNGVVGDVWARSCSEAHEAAREWKRKCHEDDLASLTPDERELYDALRREMRRPRSMDGAA